MPAAGRERQMVSMTGVCSSPARFASQADREPFDFFERIREQGPVVWDEDMTAWLVSGYDDCVFIEQREDLFRLPYPNLGYDQIQGRRSLFMLTGDQHRALYTRTLQYFSPGTVKRYREDVIRPLAADRVARLIPRGHADLAADVAEQVPVRVIAAMLGMDWRDEEFAERCWSAAEPIVRHANSIALPDGGAGLLHEAVAAQHRLGELIAPILRNRNDQPREAFVNVMWHAGKEVFDDWSEADLADQCRFLFVAGMHTTTELIANAIYILLSNPAMLNYLRADPDRRTRSFIEEALRLLPSLNFRLRIAAGPVDLHGVRLRAGDRIVVLTGAANRDPSRYVEPSKVNLDRPAITRHLAFNTGARYCAGAPLARVEAIETVHALITGLPGLRPDPDQPIPTFTGFIQRMYRPLFVRFDQPGSS